MSYGWGRVEILGALVNGVFLITVVMFICLDALERFIEPKVIDRPPLVLIVGGIGLAVNLIGMFMFGGHAPQPGHNHSHGDEKNPKKIDSASDSHSDNEVVNDMELGQVEVLETVDLEQPAVEEPKKEKKEKHGHSHGKEKSHDSHGHSHGKKEKKHGHSHGKEKSHDSHGHSHTVNANMFGVFLHIFGDFLGSIGVMITATLLMIFDASTNRWVVYIDPAISVILSIIILTSSVPLVVSSATVLVQGVPKGLKISVLSEKIKSIPGVLDIHEFHVWQLVNARHVSSIHVRCLREEFDNIAPAIQQIMHEQGVHSTTVQPEFVDSGAEFDVACALRCNAECDEDWCCPPASTPLLKEIHSHEH
jgi:zinc transporter 1